MHFPVSGLSGYLRDSAVFRNSSIMLFASGFLGFFSSTCTASPFSFEPIMASKVSWIMLRSKSTVSLSTAFVASSSSSSLRLGGKAIKERSDIYAIDNDNLENNRMLDNRTEQGSSWRCTRWAITFSSVMLGMTKNLLLS
jgi:hypothetical protein